MKKVLLLLFCCFCLLGCEKKNIEQKIDKSVISNLSNTTMMVLCPNDGVCNWPRGNSFFEDKEFINDILEMLANAKEVESTYTKFDFNMILRFSKGSSNEGDASVVLEEVFIYPDFKTIGLASIDNGMVRYSIPEDYDLKAKLEAAGVKFYHIGSSATTPCTGKDLFYEDDNYKYYVDCVGKGEIWISFFYNKTSMSLIDAINNNYITIEEVDKEYPEYFTKVKK